MPEVTIDGKIKHFAYSKAGYKAARRARRQTKRNYSSDAIKMARKMI